MMGTGATAGRAPSHWMVPFYKIIGRAAPDAPIGAHAWVPSDDENTWTFSVTWNPDRPISRQERAAMHAEGGLYATIDSKYYPIRNQANDYLIDRYKQKTESYTGILGGREQDRSIQESMGKVVERNLEHLGTSDTAIIAFRRLLINLARDLEKGKEPFAAGHGDAYKVRSTSIVSSEPEAFDVAAREQLVSHLA